MLFSLVPCDICPISKFLAALHHIAPDTRLVKICWIILVISTFVCSLSKQHSQSGDIYQFAQMGEC